ncbi:hypothetical protein J4477_01455 [Candidatus Pacearchaeota archaeon]|nr:hypothetical protein [Candidatus Pacearchaeota archaeon]
MKTLYVCRANMGRSQIAMAYHNSINNLEAYSAGTQVKKERIGKKLGNLDGIVANVIMCMGEEGINMLNWPVTQLNREMVNKYDLIVVMAEKETWPDYLEKSDKTVFWDVEDPKGKGIETHRKVRDEIKFKVRELVVCI